VIVITHDDAYFSLADRCLKLQDGKLFEIPIAKTIESHGKADSFTANVMSEMDASKNA
jgi:ABC-type siderophore export system fused ATPase/permease subunit